MPLYEYECTACHRRTEKRQKFSDPELTVCPFCNGPLERTLTAPAFHFAGGGWYKDGYASAKPEAAASGEAKSEKSGEAAASSSDKPSGGSSGSDSAPAASSTPAAGTPAPASAPAAPAKSSN